MKIELQCGDIITIPEGCKATIKDGSVVSEKIQEFKDGDILTLLHNNKVVFIFRENKLKQNDDRNNYYVCYTANYHLDVTPENSPFFCGHREEACFATNEEKQFLFNKMKEKGLRWNAELKQVEITRNRVEFGKDYLFINTSGEVVKVPDYTDPNDDGRFSLGNYYLLEERAQAEKDAAEIRAIFEKRVKAQV